MTGLLFLMTLLIIILLKKANTEIQIEQQRWLGQLILNNPELEAEYIKIFEDETWESKEKAIATGKEILEKYGYQNGNTQSANIIKSYSNRIVIWILIIAAFIIGGYFAINRSDYKKTVFELQEFIDCMNQYLAGNYVYHFKTTKPRREHRRLIELFKELGAYFQLLKEQMEREEGKIKSLVTDISHQLKNPLASLKMSYEIADSASFSQAEQNAFLLQGKEEVKKLDSLFEALINVSRLEAHMIQIVPVLSSIKKTLFSAVNSIYMKAFDKQIEISMEEFTDLELPHDPKWTEEVIVNILDNAVKYAEENTHIEIKVNSLVSYVLIEIADEGIGIPRSEMNKIFRRFYRGQSKEVSGIGGSGVGLYLARRILEEQGGNITVTSGRNKGSIFQVMLPKEHYSCEQ